jgi:predicted N-acetyltransferase YhbS
MSLLALEYSHPQRDDAPEIIALWNAAFGADFPLTQRLLLQTLDGDPFYESEGCFVARENERIIGWVLSKSMQSAGPELGRFQKRGGIGALCVHPERQNQGIGGELLNRAENFLRKNNSPVTLLYYPHHLLPGIPAQNQNAREFFSHREYSGWRECVDLRRDLHDFAVPEKVWRALDENPTVEMRPARENESAALIDFVAREFPGGWNYSTRAHFQRNGKASDFIIALENNEIIGFCHTADFRSNWLLPSTYWFPLLGEKFGGLGPVGLGKAQRKRGLGLALTALSVADLKARGVEKMAIDWTNLIAFYEQLGFTVWKKYLQGEKTV